MITKTDKHINAARLKLNHFLVPNITYYIELDKYSARHAVIRYALHDHGNNTYSVTETAYNKGFSIGECVSKTLRTFAHEFKAEEYLESCATLLEQEGYEFADEFSAKIMDFTALPIKINRTESILAMDFFKEQHLNSNQFITQKISGGVLAYVVMDAQGSLTVHAGAQANKRSIEIKDGDMYHTLRSFFVIPGFRGAILEVVIDVSSFSITDCAYFSNQWTTDKSVEERISILKNGAKQSGIDENLIIAGEITQAKDWLTINNRGYFRGFLIKPLNSTPAAGTDERSVSSNYMVTQTKATPIALGNKEKGLTGVMNGETLKHIAYVIFPSWLSHKYAEYKMSAFNGTDVRCPIYT